MCSIKLSTGTLHLSQIGQTDNSEHIYPWAFKYRLHKQNKGGTGGGGRHEAGWSFWTEWYMRLSPDSDSQAHFLHLAH